MEDPTRNPFGFVDHSAFGGFGVDLVWGLDPDGIEVHIQAAKRGLACGLICPACRAPLIARKGAKKAPHFSHQGKGSGCGSGRETNAHYWAKQLLIEKKQIWTPVVTAKVGGVSRIESKPRWMRFSDVRSERRLGGIVPDIVLILSDKRELIVEIAVTHPCGEEKIALIQENSWPAIEINLRHLRSCQNIAVIERGLLEEAPRSWLCNPRRDRAEIELLAELERAAEARAEAERLKASQETARQRRQAQAIEFAARALVQAADDARKNTPLPRDPAIIELIKSEWRDLIGITTGGEGFDVTPAEWQASIIDQFVSVDDIRSFEAETFSFDSVLRYLEPLIAPAFRTASSNKVRQWIREHHPGFRFPPEAVEDYLEALCMAGALQWEGEGHYGLPDDQVKEIRRQQRRLIEADGRAATAHALVDEIVTDLPPNEVVDFDAQLWLETPLAASGMTPTQVIVEGGLPYSDFIADLGGLAKMAAGEAEVVDELLGLPLTAARYRAVERRTAQQSQEASERTGRLREAADRILGSDAAAWLGSPIGQEGEMPLALANAGAAGLQLGMDALAVIELERERARIVAAAVAARREKLKALVTKLFEPKFRDFALRNHSTALGCSPWDACKSDYDFESAVRVLTDQAGHRSRRR